MADGSIKIVDVNNKIERSGSMIYEFPYLGKSYKEYMA
ncbi:hypothetical protein LAC1533_2318 [Ligilactobacillus acidipiscis]|jgi:hypothetical protein|uniref:Uncharacterized protein n=1 Tax=Ligilactobacillus acidipiscis TaxID=89059 RepID=A0A1K1KS63_9LACO|nr:hypothetical protein LAC1533_2318 [Ligilactobacillus acidipiscis]